MILIGLLSIIIGILLGLLGGGGSILTVPVLVYLAKLSAQEAIVTSLIVVCLTSLIAVISHARHRRVCWKTGLTFGIAGMLGAYAGGRLSAYIPDVILLALFALLMIAASFSMIKKPKTAPASVENCEENFCPKNLPVSAILLDGVLVGLITGLIGVGGGFLLVPALTLLAGLPIQAAIGTSLFIIVLQSISALFGHAGHITLNLQLTTIVTLCAIIGSFVGSYLSSIIHSRYLKPGFGFFVLFLGSFLLYQEMSADLIQQILNLVKQHREFFLGASSIILSLLFYRFWAWLH
jgi:uncharacterized membrane protein YfcA